METEDYTKESSVKENLLSAINDGEVEMRPRWHFLAHSILAAIGAMFLLMWVLYVVSLILFSLRKTGALQMPAFGAPGWYEFFAVLPWLLIAVSVLAIILLESLLHRYAFAYRQPVLYSFVALLFIAICGAIAVDRMQVHTFIRTFSTARGLYPVESFYQDIDCEHDYRFIKGGVIQNGTDEVIVAEEDGSLSRIVFDTRAQFAGERGFATSDTIFVFGDRDGDVVHARGLRLLPQ